MSRTTASFEEQPEQSDYHVVHQWDDEQRAHRHQRQRHHIEAIRSARWRSPDLAQAPPQGTLWARSGEGSPQRRKSREEGNCEASHPPPRAWIKDTLAAMRRVRILTADL